MKFTVTESVWGVRVGAGSKDTGGVVCVSVCLCEGARRQPFKILFPASEEANPAPIIPCSQKHPSFLNITTPFFSI